MKRKAFRRMVSVILAAAMILCVMMPIEVFAQDDLQEYVLSYDEYYKTHNLAVAKMIMGEEKTEIVWPENYLANGDAPSNQFSNTVVNAVLNGMISGKSSINTGTYNLYIDDIPALFAYIENEYPLEFIASDFYYYGYSYYTGSGKVASIGLYYHGDISQRNYTQRYSNLENAVNNIISKTDLTDEFTTTLDFHDYLVLNSQYDTTYSIYDAYTILVNGVGVCQAYADAFRLLCNLTDVPCITVSSEGMNHAWNMVEIDGDWYHIDATWDDPVPDVAGRNYYTNMYHSDASFEANCDHYGWDSDNIIADSEKFANMPRRSGYQQLFENNLWYYVDGDSINTCDRYGNNDSDLIKNVSSDSLGYYKGLLAYSNGKSIYTYNLSSKKIECVYTMVPEESGDWANHSSVRIKNMNVSEDGLITYTCYTWKYKPDTGSYVSNIIDGVNTVQLTAPSVTVESVALDKYELNLEVSQQEKLNVVITPDNVNINSIVWSTSDSDVVTVDNGTVTAVGAGSAVITVEVDGISASCNVNVIEASLPEACVFKIDDANIYWITYDAAIQIDVPCQYKNGVTYVPFRAVASVAGAKSIKYSSATDEITIVNNKDEVFTMTINSKKLSFVNSNGTVNSAELNSAPIFIDSLVCLPIRETAGIANASVKYIEKKDGAYVIVSPAKLSDDELNTAIELYNQKF